MRKTAAGTTCSWRRRSAAAWHSGAWVTDVACVVGKGPRDLRTTVKVPLGGRCSWSRSLAYKGVAVGKFMAKADTMNSSAGIGHMLANASSLEISPFTHIAWLFTTNSW